TVIAKKPSVSQISLGLVDGRNVWRTDLSTAVAQIKAAVKAFGKSRVTVSPSCSLLHSPVDLEFESRLDPEIRGWMAFAKQKLQEVSILAQAVEDQRPITKELAASDACVLSRKESPRIHKLEVQRRANALTEAMASRKSP